MRSIEDKGCLNYGPTQEISSSNNSTAMTFEFHQGNGTNRASHHRTALGKPTPSKWDDAQKWLVNLSRGGGGGGGGGEKNQSKTKPRNSNADDRRLIAPVPKKEDYSSGDEEVGGEGNECHIDFANSIHFDVETKKVDREESIWRINKPAQSPVSVVRSICVRDMGTEMTPIASQEPSRTATPIRATTPAVRSPISSGSSTPVRALERSQTGLTPEESRGDEGRGGGGNRGGSRDLEETSPGKGGEGKNLEQAQKMNHLETQAIAWDEAERAKYMARYKREEVKIQAWENHEKRKAEMEMKRMEVKAERLKARAQERLANKLAATRRIAEEKLANAGAKLNEKAVTTSERADYIRRTGNLPSSFSFKLPSICW